MTYEHRQEVIRFFLHVVPWLGLAIQITGLICMKTRAIIFDKRKCFYASAGVSVSFFGCSLSLTHLLTEGGLGMLGMAYFVLILPMGWPILFAPMLLTYPIIYIFTKSQQLDVPNLSQKLRPRISAPILEVGFAVSLCPFSVPIFFVGRP